MIEIKNCVFDSQDTATTLKKCTTHGLVLNGTEDILVENCEFRNRGYSAINVNAEGAVVIKDCTFECGNIYNPIEGGQSGAGNSRVSIVNNTFNGQSGNNYINFYRFQEGAVIELKDNKFPAVSSDSEVIRVSNSTSAKVTYNVDSDEFAYIDSSVGAYTSYIMCQDYSAKNGVVQDFGKVTFNLHNVKCNGEVMSADSVAQGKLTFTYQDGTGIIPTNQPVINFK